MTRDRLERLAGWVGLAAAAGMLVVLVMGATVTDTGSAQGCARDWPLCRGRFIPEFAVSTAIEFSHRAVTGVEGILIVAFAALALALYRRREVTLLVALMLAALVLQAGLGAAAVRWPQQAAVLALHFGISLIAVATTSVLAFHVRWPEAARARPPVPVGLRLATWGALTYVYALVYTGAYIRHAGAGTSCVSWPLCGGAGLGFAGRAPALNLVHRGAAGLSLVVALGLLLAYRRLETPRRDLVGGATALLAALLAQAAAGALLPLSGFGLFASLLHAGLTGVLFTAAAYCCMRVSFMSRAAESPARAAPAGTPQRA